MTMILMWQRSYQLNNQSKFSELHESQKKPLKGGYQADVRDDVDHHRPLITGTWRMLLNKQFEPLFVWQHSPGTSAI